MFSYLFYFQRVEGEGRAKISGRLIGLGSDRVEAHEDNRSKSKRDRSKALRPLEVPTKFFVSSPCGATVYLSSATAGKLFRLDRFNPILGEEPCRLSIV
jgi:hypothetical protein